MKTPNSNVVVNEASHEEKHEASHEEKHEASHEEKQKVSHFSFKLQTRQKEREGSEVIIICQ